MTNRGSWIRYFASHPTAANLLMIIFVFAGLLSIRDLRRETFPDFSPTQVEILVKYPGATAEDVENAVCRRVEDALDGVSNVREIQSEARENQGRIVAEMRDGGNMAQFLSDVKTEVEAIDDFPEEVERPVVRQLGQTDMVLSIAVTGPMSVPHLKAFCEKIKDRMVRLDEISQVDILGFSDHQIRIEVPAVTLMQLGLSVSDIVDRITGQSVDLPSGTVETRDAEVLIRFSDERRSVHEFEDLIVVADDTGAEIPLGDIAKITDRFELDEEKIIFNGKRAGILRVNKTKTEDALRILDKVKVFLEQERRSSPPGVCFNITWNVSEIVRDRLNLLAVNGAEGLVLVFLTMWLFFSFRFSFWVVMGLPISFLGTIFCMQLIGFSLNMITMVGLLIAVGLLMDDAIVISENVATHLKKGKRPLDAVVDGVTEVSPGVLSSFLTTLIICSSLALLTEGDIGKVLWVMPVVLILTLSVSLVEAFCILPNHLAHSLESMSKDTHGKFRQRRERLLEYLREKVLGPVVDWAVSWRYLSLGLTITLFLLSLGTIAGGFLKIEAFPDIEGDIIQARILLPQGTPLSRTESIVKRVSDALKRVNMQFTPEQPGKQTLVKNVNIQFNMNIDAFESGPHVATVTADLLGAEKRNTSIDEFVARWRKEVGAVPDVINITYKETAYGPAGLAIDIRLKGDDLNHLKQASMELMHWLNSYEGVLDLNDDLRPGKPEIRARLKRGAMTMGVEAGSVANQLRSAFHGKKAGDIQVGSESYEVDVRLTPADQNSLGDLDYFHVTTRTGKQVPLGSIATLEQSRGFARIQRIDSVRTVTIRGDIDTNITNAAEIISDTRARFLPELKKRYPDVGFTLEGQAKETRRSMGSMQKAFLVGIFGIFVLLSFQFKSYLEPLVVLVTIPLAFIGVIWGHIFMGLDLCMPSIMGFVALSGVVVNDSILLVTFIKIRIRHGKDGSEAAGTASRQRFRAVLLTSLTTVMGLVPLLSERSLQAQFLIPLATSIVFGLLASTVLVLIVIPVMYTILGDFGLISPNSKG
ncbi:MAG: efflux RND transporter permease subunit [Thermodesulfobacteriota bacterium]|nr:efflux RND transporter permease subunit [Thermodesulfobacteriota bacterium]